jgi:proline iminopeptidase
MATKTRVSRRTNPAAKGRRTAAAPSAKASTTKSPRAKASGTRSSSAAASGAKTSMPKRSSKAPASKAAASKAPRPTTSSAAKRKSASLPHDLRTLYPPIKPYKTGFLRVSDLHELYYEESGNPQGKPAVFLHGGPGSGTDGKMRSFFDPKRYRIILFDQRGCGKSRPNASLVDNTTWHLVEDIEKLREHLDIERWLVFGGSWGSTLALAYAETHPQRVTELVLRGIFLLRRWEIEWFYQNPGGAGALYPDLWERYVAPIAEGERADMVSAYYKQLTSEDPQVLGQAARAWSVWEGATSYLRLNPDYVSKFQEDIYAATFARIECHYFINKGFLKTDAQLLEDVDRIRHIPTVIVQGRYDVICPMKSAWDLHRAWPEADLRVVPDAGHSAFEAGNIHELVSATDRFARAR